MTMFSLKKKIVDFSNDDVQPEKNVDFSNKNTK